MVENDQIRLVGPHVVVVAYDGLCTFEFGIAVEVFGLPRPELGPDWYRFTVCSAENKVLQATGGVRLQIDNGLEALESADIAIVPGWRSPHQLPPANLTDAIVAAHQRGARVVGICGGVFVLAATGLLSNRCATTHWRFLEALVEQHPDVLVCSAPLFCDVDRILTSAGSCAGIDLCLHIVRTDYGTKIADQVARRLVVPRLRDGDHDQLPQETLVPEDQDQQLTVFVEQLQEDVVTNYTIESAARELGMSTRTFSRRFKSLTGESYGVWMSLQKLERAKTLLSETKLPIGRITEACGLASSDSLRRLFRRFLRESPKQYRKRFSPSN